MDPSSTPWRTFDAPGSTPPGPDAPPAAIPRSSLLAGIGAIVLLVAGAAFLAAGAGGGRAVLIDTAASAEPSAGAGAGVEAILVVDIAGAVVQPGVYRLPAGSRVGDAITAAGGYGPRVDAARVGAELNLAAPLTDGQHLAVPSRDDVAAGGDETGGTGDGSGGSGGSGGGSPGAGGLVDLNRATSAELDALPGIGPVTAAKILAARESAPFTAVQDLLDRKLVGQKTFDGLRDLVTVN